MGKARIALALPPQRVTARRTPDLAHLSEQAPATWGDTLARAAARARRYGLRVTPYGALLWRGLLGLRYLHAGSDLDLLWRCPGPVPAGFLEDLLRLAASAPVRRDGEVVVERSGVQWRELAGAGRTMPSCAAAAPASKCARPAGSAPRARPDRTGPRHRPADRAGRIAEAARGALLVELEADPKPGLVSRVDPGSHDDMDAAMFESAVAAIAPFFAELARAGAAGAEMSELRRIGLGTEAAMLAVTGGVNTHRGAIFGLGLLSAPAGAHPWGAAGAEVRRRWRAGILAGPGPGDHPGAGMGPEGHRPRRPARR